MVDSRRRLLGVLLCTLVGAAVTPAAGWAAPGAPDPVLFVPFEVSPTLAEHEEFLRQLLAARLVATGRFSETATAETEAAVQDCVRRVNREAHSETCWIRLGQGQGARLMATGQIKGDTGRCAVSLRLTELETRTSRRMHVSRLAPCGEAALTAEIERGAWILAGLTPPPAPTPAGHAPRPRAAVGATPGNVGFMRAGGGTSPTVAATPHAPPTGAYAQAAGAQQAVVPGYGPGSPAAQAAAAPYRGGELSLSGAPAAHAAAPPLPSPLPLQRARGDGSGSEGSGSNTLLWIGVGAAAVTAAAVLTYYLVKQSSDPSTTSDISSSSGGAVLGVAGLGVATAGGAAWIGLQALPTPTPPELVAAAPAARPPLGPGVRASF